MAQVCFMLRLSFVRFTPTIVSFPFLASSTYSTHRSHLILDTNTLSISHHTSPTAKMDYLKTAFNYTKLTLLSFTDHKNNPFSSQQLTKATRTMAEEKAPQPTSAEAFLFYSIVKNLRTRPDINWEGVARDNGFKNAETAKVRYGQVKRKLNIENWSPPVKPQGGRSSGSGVGKTEMDQGTSLVSSKPKAGTGAGVVKKRTNNNGKGGGKKTPAKVMEEEDDDDDDEEEEEEEKSKAKGIDAALARLSPTPTGRAQRQVEFGSAIADVDEYISSLQSRTPIVAARQVGSYPPRGVKIAGEVYLKTAIPVRGLGDVWTVKPVSPEGHEAWFQGLGLEDQNRFMEEAVEFFVKSSEEGVVGENALVVHQGGDDTGVH
ncbi:hypothetical protein QC763_605795 [Podospora pseudopauciseta]|uniref:Uncharacterized protein n=1 Tax=Podospora pseudopauciseta TaxID=2093780 RepID=A0ABR0H3W1_9PEZI|nr:hypothetical protein QC763_605795 [Podospora pseudopauciseta]